MKFLNPFDNDPVDNYKVTAQPEEKKGRAAILTADDTEDLEFFYPYYRLSEEGYMVDVITPNGGEFKGKKGLGLKETLKLESVNPSGYALIYIPGGKAPAELRKNEKAISFVREFALSGKPIAAICHGAQLLVSAGLVKGKRIAAWPEVKDEIEEAGGTFVDESLVEDGKFITARKPGDLPHHLAGVLNYLNGASSTNTATSSKKAVA